MPAELIPAPRRRRARRRPHRRVLAHLAEQGVPFLVGGGYALRHYTGDVRGTRDLDVFVRRRDARRLLDALAALGLETELTFPHWLGKAGTASESIDVIYSSGNGVAAVDDDWFEHAVPATVLGVRVRPEPARGDDLVQGVRHGARALRRRRRRAPPARARRRDSTGTGCCAASARHWRVLFAHLVLFGFIYPSERDAVPAQGDAAPRPSPGPRGARAGAGGAASCRGTLLSRAQYLTDVSRWGYADARLGPDVRDDPGGHGAVDGGRSDVRGTKTPDMRLAAVGDLHCSRNSPGRARSPCSRAMAESRGRAAAVRRPHRLRPARGGPRAGARAGRGARGPDPWRCSATTTSSPARPTRSRRCSPRPASRARRRRLRASTASASPGVKGFGGGFGERALAAVGRGDHQAVRARGRRGGAQARVGAGPAAHRDARRAPALLADRRAPSRASRGRSIRSWGRAGSRSRSTAIPWPRCSTATRTAARPRGGRAAACPSTTSACRCCAKSTRRGRSGSWSSARPRRVYASRT